MKMRSLLVTAALALVSSMAIADTNNSLGAHADADSGTFIAATLCSGTATSFDCRVSPAYSKNAMTRRAATVALVKQQITVEQAQAVLDRTDQARALLDQALATCDVDSRTGNCKKNRVQAERLLAQAQQLLN